MDLWERRQFGPSLREEPAIDRIGRDPGMAGPQIDLRRKPQPTMSLDDFIDLSATLPLDVASRSTSLRSFTDVDPGEGRDPFVSVELSAAWVPAFAGT